jgi:hypothetical protein
LFQELYRQIARVSGPARLPRASVERLALLVIGIIAARSCVLARVAAELDALGLTAAGCAEHIGRRLRRTLNDPHLPPACYRAALQGVLDWSLVVGSRRPVVLAVDDSSKADQLHLLRLSLCYWGGSLPLAWALWEQNRAQPDGAYWTAFDRLLAEAAPLLPAGQAVVLTGDRAFDVPPFVDRVTAYGWHWAARVKANGDLRFRQAPGREVPLRTLVGRHVGRPGRRWKARGQVFKKAGWRTVSVVGVWAPGAQEPLVVLTDLPPAWSVLRLYDGRFWIETGFRADKRGGWQWESSQVQGVAHHQRLLLGLAWASLAMCCLGLQQAQERLAALAARPPKRRPPKPQPARASLFTLGLQRARHWLYRPDQARMPWSLRDPAGPSWKDRWYAAQAQRYVFASPVRP